MSNILLTFFYKESLYNNHEQLSRQVQENEIIENIPQQQLQQRNDFDTIKASYTQCASFVLQCVYSHDFLFFILVCVILQ